MNGYIKVVNDTKDMLRYRNFKNQAKILAKRIYNNDSLKEAPLVNYFEPRGQVATIVDFNDFQTQMLLYAYCILAKTWLGSNFNVVNSFDNDSADDALLEARAWISEIF